MIHKLIIVACVTIVGSATICVPQLLAKNSFLDAFITFEILNVLAVIVTVTLASVANIHLSLNRIVRVIFKDRALGEAKAANVRKEINQNAWLLMGLFVACVAVLLLKGWLADDGWIESLLNGAALTILVANVLVLYDIYSVIYSLISAEGRFGSSKPPPAEESY